MRASSKQNKLFHHAYCIVNFLKEIKLDWNTVFLENNFLVYLQHPMKLKRGFCGDTKLNLIVVREVGVGLNK